MTKTSLGREAGGAGGDPADAALRLAAAAPAGHFDELRTPEGTLRSHWRGFFEQLGNAGLGDLDRRLGLLRRRVQEHGVTYNVYGDEHGPARRWLLDLLPFIVARDEWKIIEEGVVQRAALLSALMKDIYGEQRLLRDGLLPPSLVLGNPSYLRPLQGFSAPGGVYLHLIAFDLARAPDGHWWVASQRTQAPSGLGYALENRLIVSRLFADGFAALRVQRLASSFRRLLETLHRLAPRDPGEGGEDARIVLLTPGRYNETYFEHAYLARYLGVPLVEGHDLTVRDDRLFLKTLYGLERVHAVMRRVDDAFCDPLELRPESALGVPGLVQAVRAGHVLVANPIGSRLLESPAIQGFLPAIARRLLGEEMKLPSRDTWWCGEASSRAYALEHLELARLRPSYPGATHEPDVRAGSGLVRLADWRERIEANPDAYTVQSYRPYSKTPNWQGGALSMRSAVVRVYAIATADGRWHAMPGGLTRIADPRGNEVSMQRGGSSADTWVITGEEVDPFSMLSGPLRVEDIANRRRVVTSRAAENLFWMGRYTERADNSVRTAQQVLTALRGDERLPAPVAAAIRTQCLAQGLVPFEVPSPSAGPRVFERTLLAGLSDPAGASVAFDLGALARSAAEIRERLASEHWRLIVDTAEHFTSAQRQMAARGRLSLDESLRALGEVAVRIGAITGAQTDGMTRDDGWRLLTIGRQIERLVCMTAMLQSLFADKAVQHQAGFDLALALANSTITYRSRYPGRQELAALIDLLVLEVANPRSLACAVDVIARESNALAGAAAGRADGLGPELATGRIEAGLDELCERDGGKFARLIALMQRLNGSAQALSDWIGLQYFSHSELPRSMVL